MENKRLDGYSNRAMVISKEGYDFLLSYWTIVGYKDKEGNFHRTWDGYSNTTVHNHVRKFGFDFSKKEWEALPLEKFPDGMTYNYIVDKSTSERDIPNYSENYWLGPSWQKGTSYGF